MKQLFNTDEMCTLSCFVSYLSVKSHTDRPSDFPAVLAQHRRSAVCDVLPGASGQTVHQLPHPRVQWLPWGGSGDFSLGQWGRGKISLLPGAESAGFEHQALPPVQPVHLSEEPRQQPLRAQVQGKKSVEVHRSSGQASEIKIPHTADIHWR